MSHDDTRLADELRDVLAPGGMTPEERREMADEARRAADAAAGAEPPRRGRVVALTAGAGAAAAVTLAWLLGAFAPTVPTEKPSPAPVAAAPATIEAERTANEAALAAPETQAALATAPEGAFAVVAGGKLIGVGTDLPKLLAAADTEFPEAAHRFVFRLGEQGDVDRGRIPDGSERLVGTGFFAAVGVEMSVGADGVELRANGKTVPGLLRGVPKVHLSYGGLARITFLESTGTPVNSTRSTSTTFTVSTGFAGTLFLPFGESYPRSEIPGFATVKDAAGQEIRCRRYLVRAAISRLEVSELVEALGSMGSGSSGGWLTDLEAAMAESKRTGRSLLVLVGEEAELPTGVLESEALRPLLDTFVRVRNPLAPGGRPAFAGAPGEAYAGLFVLHPERRPPPQFRIGGTLPLDTKTRIPNVLEFLDRESAERVPDPDPVLPAWMRARLEEILRRRR